MGVEEKICKCTWTNLCGGMNICLLCRQSSCSQSSLKKNITNVIVCEIFHFFMNLTHWKLPKRFSEVYRASEVSSFYCFFVSYLCHFCYYYYCHYCYYYYYYYYWIVACCFLPTGMLYFLRYSISKTPHTSITFRRILLVCIKTIFYNSVILVSIPMVFNLFSSSLAGVPRAPTTNGTTITFIFHTFFSSLARSKYFSIFSTSLSSTDGL